MTHDLALLDGHAVADADLTDWRMLFATLQARFSTRDFATGLRLVEAIATEAERADHHPDVDLRYGSVHVTLSSHDAGGVTRRDVRLARAISVLAADLGVAAAPEALSVTELALDAADLEAVKPFWRAVLDYVDGTAPDEIRDPDGRRPTLWFQPTDPHPEPRQRFHLDVRVPPETVERRLAAALAAGGTLVSDADAPRFWVLADPEGNKACLTTWLGREPVTGAEGNPLAE